MLSIRALIPCKNNPCYKQLMQPTLPGASLLASEPSEACLVIVAGVHGNEPAGVRAIEEVRRLLSQGDWKIDGTVFSLIGNPRAVEANARFIDENLNRVFEDAKDNGSYEARRAEEIRTWFAELARSFKRVFVLDLHSVSIGEVYMTIFNADNPGCREWAERVSAIPLRFAYTAAIVPGSLIGAIEKLGGIGISIECGNHASESGTTVALEHIEGALQELHMLKHGKSFRGTVYPGTKRTYTLFASINPSSGFAFTIPVESEMRLSKGQIFALDETGDHRAPQDCYLIMPAKDPNPGDTGAGFLATLDN